MEPLVHTVLNGFQKKIAHIFFLSFFTNLSSLRKILTLSTQISGAESMPNSIVAISTSISVAKCTFTFTHFHPLEDIERRRDHV